MPSHFSPQRLSHNLHPANSEPCLAQVLQRGTDMIHCVVDAEEAVVGVLERIDGDGAVLRIVALQVEGKLLRDVACVNLCGRPRFELSQILRQLPCLAVLLSRRCWCAFRWFFLKQILHKSVIKWSLLPFSRNEASRWREAMTRSVSQECRRWRILVRHEGKGWDFVRCSAVFVFMPWAGMPKPDWVGRGGRADMAGKRPLCAMEPMMSALNFWSFCFKTKGQEFIQSS